MLHCPDTKFSTLSSARVAVSQLRDTFLFADAHVIHDYQSVTILRSLTRGMHQLAVPCGLRSNVADYSLIARQLHRDA